MWIVYRHLVWGVLAANSTDYCEYSSAKYRGNKYPCMYNCRALLRVQGHLHVVEMLRHFRSMVQLHRHSHSGKWTVWSRVWTRQDLIVWRMNAATRWYVKGCMLSWHDHRVQTNLDLQIAMTFPCLCQDQSLFHDQNWLLIWSKE